MVFVYAKPGPGTVSTQNRQIYDQKMSTSQEIHRLDGALELLRLPGLGSFE